MQQHAHVSPVGTLRAQAVTALTHGPVGSTAAPADAAHAAGVRSTTSVAMAQTGEQLRQEGTHRGTHDYGQVLCNAATLRHFHICRDSTSCFGSSILKRPLTLYFPHHIRAFMQDTAPSSCMSLRLQCSSRCAAVLINVAQGRTLKTLSSEDRVTSRPSLPYVFAPRRSPPVRPVHPLQPTNHLCKTGCRLTPRGRRDEGLDQHDTCCVAAALPTQHARPEPSCRS